MRWRPSRGTSLGASRDVDAQRAHQLTSTRSARRSASTRSPYRWTPLHADRARRRDSIPLLLLAARRLRASETPFSTSSWAPHIGPQLGKQAFTFIHRYPSSQAALARLDPTDSRVALRFELYGEGIELANGFHELASATEQRTRFEHDLTERKRLGLPADKMDELLLDALAHGLPECAGVAVGFDRLLMLATGANQIDDVLPFPIERA